MDAFEARVTFEHSMAAEARDSATRGASRMPQQPGLCVVEHPPETVPTAHGRSAPLEVLLGLPCAVLVVDGNGDIRLANADAGRRLGCDHRMLVGRSIGDILGPLELLRAQGQSHREATISIRMPSGATARIGYTLAKVELDAEESLYSIVFRDISHESSIVTERDRLLRLASLGAAAPTVIHEVKNSLAALTMGLELQAARSTDETTRANLEALLGEARHVSQTLVGFGAVGRDLKTQRPANITAMLRDARRVLRARVQRDGVELAWLDSVLPPLYLDPAVLHAIVFNLVTNAINACNPGDWVSVHAEVQGGKFLLVVEDSGVGMSPDVVQRCTELFFTTRREGNGIGLALCKEAIHAAGGQLEISSQLGRGTRMTIRIPGVIPACETVSAEPRPDLR